MKKKIFISIIIIVILGLTLSFVVHELSHFLILELMGGKTQNISVGIENYVTGYISPDKIPIVALGSIFIPLAICCMLVFIKQIYIQVFCGVFIISPLMNCLFGLIMAIMETNISVRETYDVTLAIDNSGNPIGVWVFVSFCLFTSIAIVFRNSKYIINNF